jgi:hypothetical protein
LEFSFPEKRVGKRARSRNETSLTAFGFAVARFRGVGGGCPAVPISQASYPF